MGKQKAAQAKADADEQVQAVQRNFALKEQAAGLEILERKRQRAFMADLEAQKLPIQDGKGAGL